MTAAPFMAFIVLGPPVLYMVALILYWIGRNREARAIIIVLVVIFVVIVIGSIAPPSPPGSGTLDPILRH